MITCLHCRKSVTHLVGDKCELCKYGKVAVIREKHHGNMGNKYALKGESNASKNINIRIQPTLLNAAKQRAKENNIPFSVWLLGVINKEMVND